MLQALEKELKALVHRAGSQREVLLDSGAGMLRIDLKPENLALWSNTLAEAGPETNLLLACESSSGELNTTRLTWVVGAAIRPAVIENIGTAKKLLQSLGASLEQTSLVGEQCPGLGKELTWAIYLDRHGWLSVSPVPSDGDLTWLLNQAP